MKILHINASYKPAYVYGGPTMSVSMLCEQLHTAGIDVEVFTTTANGQTELSVTANTTIIVDGVPVTYFKRITKDHTHLSPALLSTLRRRVTEFDAVHIHAWWNMVSVLACYIALKKGIPVILSPRGTLSSYSFSNRNSGKKSLIHHLLGKNLLKRIYIHATSNNEAGAVSSLVGTESITVIPNFVKLPKITAIIPPENNDPFKLLFFSRIEEKKGLDILLNALPSIKFPFSLTIAGNGDAEYIKQLKTLITDESINARINWAGFYNEDKFKLISSHHLLVLPSHNENFGNVVIESLSVGTAVLVSTNVGLAKYINEKELGWLCKVNANDVADKINKVYYKHQTDLNRIRQTAAQIIRHDFTPNELVKHYLELYRKVIE